MIARRDYLIPEGIRVVVDTVLIWVSTVSKEREFRG